MTEKPRQPLVAPDLQKDLPPERSRFVWEDGDIEIFEEVKRPIKAKSAPKPKRKR